MSNFGPDQGRTRVYGEAYFLYAVAENPRRTPSRAKRAIYGWALAKACGRERSKSGKEPNWINPEFQKLYPLSIPHHGELNKYTARSILNQLEADLDYIEDLLQVRDHGGKK